MADLEPKFERTLFALNPIRMTESGWGGGGAVGHLLSDGYGIDQLLTYYADTQGKIDTDISPIIRSVLAGKLTREYNPGDSVPSQNKNVFDGYITNSEADNEITSVWGQYSRPYKDEDFSFEKGKFLNPAKAFTYYKGLPWSLSALWLKPYQSVSVYGKSDGHEVGEVVFDKEVDVVYAKAQKYQFIGEIDNGYRYHVSIERLGSSTKSVYLYITRNSILAVRLSVGSLSNASGIADLSAADKVGKTDIIIESTGYEGKVRVVVKRFATKSATNVNVSRLRNIALFDSANFTTITGKNLFNKVAGCNRYLVKFDQVNPSGGFGDNKLNQVVIYAGTYLFYFFSQAETTEKRSIYGIINTEGIVYSTAKLRLVSAIYHANITNMRVYPLDDSAIYPLSDMHGSPLGLDQLSEGSYLIARTTDRDYLGMEKTTYQKFNIEIKEAPLDCLRNGSLVYIRYLNRYGGWSYALLKKLENKLANKSTSVQIPRLSIQPTDGAVAPDRYMVANEITGTFKAGAGNLSSAEVNTLSDIARSVMVDMWDVDNQCFIPIYPKDATITDNKADDQEITFEFEFSKEGW